MKWKSYLLRLFLTLAMLVGLVWFVGLKELIADIRSCDWKWMAGVVLMAPVFLYCRISKWRLMEQQVLGPSSLRSMLPRYLLGMAMGLVTPGRVGELARVRTKTLSARGGGLFFVEKSVELVCLLSYCLVAIPLVFHLPGWTWLLTIGLIIMGFAVWRHAAIKILRWFSQVTGKLDEKRLGQLSWALFNLRTKGCALLSTTCFSIYFLQCYWVLRGLGVPPNPLIPFLFPVVFLSHLAPFTIGGWGIRELVAVFVLRTFDVPDSSAVTSVALVTFFNLMVPGIVGITWHGLRGTFLNTLHPKEAASVPTPTSEGDKNG